MAPGLYPGGSALGDEREIVRVLTSMRPSGSELVSIAVRIDGDAAQVLAATSSDMLLGSTSVALAELR